MSKFSDEFEQSYIGTKNINRITKEFKRNRPKEAAAIKRLLGRFEMKGGKI